LILKEISNSIIEMSPDRTLEFTRKALEQGVPTNEIIEKGIAEGLRIVGEKWDLKEFFLSEVLTSVYCVNRAMEILNEAFKKEIQVAKLGKVVIGSVEGDLHDIGKNIVSAVLKATGFEVHDLGVDVSADQFVQAVREVEPDILGMSALLTTTSPYTKTVIDAMESAKVRDGVCVMIGGRATNEELRREVGADIYCKDAFEAARFAKQYVEGKRRSR